MSQPNARKKHLSGDRAPGVALDGHRRRRTARPIPVVLDAAKDSDQMSAMNPNQVSECLLGEFLGNQVPEVSHGVSLHGTNVESCYTKSSTNDVVFCSTPIDHVSMSEDKARKWAQQTRFKDLVNAKIKVMAQGNRLGTNVFRASIARDLDVAESTLHAMMYDKNFKPGLDLVQRSAAYFRCPIAELTGDPGAPAPDGVSEESFYGLGEDGRALMRSIEAELQGVDAVKINKIRDAIMPVIRVMKG